MNIDKRETIFYSVIFSGLTVLTMVVVKIVAYL